MEYFLQINILGNKVKKIFKIILKIEIQNMKVMSEIDRSFIFRNLEENNVISMKLKNKNGCFQNLLQSL